MLPMHKNHLPIITIAEVAEYLPKVPRGSIYKLAQQGKIPCQKVGRHWRFRREAVDEWLEEGIGYMRAALSDHGAIGFQK